MSIMKYSSVDNPLTIPSTKAPRVVIQHAVLLGLCEPAREAQIVNVIEKNNAASMKSTKMTLVEVEVEVMTSSTREGSDMLVRKDGRN
jgi:hypothetical protein